MPATPAPAVYIGRCVRCRAVHRAETPAGVWCGCRDGVRCPPGRRGCGDPDCAGHPKSAVKFAEVKVTYRPERECGSACQNARGTACACSCRGRGHGAVWATRATSG